MVKHIIFDLGNVLINIHPEKALHQFADTCGFSIARVREFFSSPIYWDHMAGVYPPETFYQKVIETYPCLISREEFQQIWNSVIGLPKEGIEKLIQELKPLYQLSVCSNTDPWHWQKVIDEVGFMQHFTHYFLSFELKMNKPDPGVFRIMLQQLNCEAKECLFIDDIRVNVIEAENLGFNTILALDTGQIVASMRKQGIID